MDPISSLLTVINVVRDVKKMLDIIQQNESDIAQIKYRLNRIEQFLEQAKSCSASVVGIVKDLEDIVGDGKGGFRAYLKAYDEKKNSKNIFNVFSRFTGGSTVKEDLKSYNNLLDQVLTDLTTALSISTNQKVAALVSNTTNSTTEMEDNYPYYPTPESSEDTRHILGKGAFATTYSVLSKLDKQKYAMKKAEKELMRKGGVNLTAISREVEILQRLNHPNIVRYHLSFESHHGQYYHIIMELVEGGSLANQVQSMPKPSETILRHWWQQCLSAIAYLHEEKHILHRDIKPENILLTLPPRQEIKLVDLGLACISQSALSNHSVIGTMLYASYEKAHGLGYTGKDDVWGIGCVFAELVTRKRLQEWGGALYEHTHVEVQQRRERMLAMCQTTCGPASRLVEGIEQALCTDKEQRPTAKALLDLATSSPSSSSSLTASAPSPSSSLRVTTTDNTTSSSSSSILTTTSSNTTTPTLPSSPSSPSAPPTSPITPTTPTIPTTPNTSTKTTSASKTTTTTTTPSSSTKIVVYGSVEYWNDRYTK